MDPRELLKFCLENGLLLDNEILKLFSQENDHESLKLVLEKIKMHTKQKIITKEVLYENKEKVNKVFLDLPKENQKNLEKLKIKLGLSIEISRESDVLSEKGESEEQIIKIQSPINIQKDFINNEIDFSPSKNFEGIKILSKDSAIGKKLEVKDFVKYFRNRFNEMKKIIEEHSELDNLVSIDKISGNRKGVSIIGLISEKRVTKNKNIIFEVEDLTGKIKVLVNKERKELYKKAEEISLDSVMGFKGSGNREIFFINDLIFPDSVLHERKKSPVEEYALFIGDLHFGSKKFLEKEFNKFIDYLNGKIPNTPEVEKIKYLFIVGDLITGVGVYPGQEADLKITDLEEQFIEVTKLLSKIRKDIKIIISPGNHEGVRLMEPQPTYDEKYAWPIYELDNVVLTGNPSELNIGAKQGFSGYNVLSYHGFSFPYYANNVNRLLKKRAMNTPDEIMKYLLKNRHLAPSHASVQYFPSSEKDHHLIKNIPDIFVSAHTHKSTASYYNNILLISVSSWESFTPYQEKFGNTPDFCKVPMLNLKTRAVKILDFE